MRQTPRCELLLGASGEHVTQLLTGFGLLARDGRVKVRLRRARNLHTESGTRLDVLLQGRWRLVYDLADAGSINPGHGIDEADTYFKRSYGPKARNHPGARKIFPLGLNYPVYGPGDWRVRRMVWAARGIRLREFGNPLTQVLRLGNWSSGALQMNSGRSVCSLEHFEQQPRVEDEPRVLLLTRTWDPSTQRDQETVARWHALNATRAACIRALRTEFGPRFVGGFAPHEYARRTYPDCVVDGGVTNKGSYLQLMKGADICIATEGLAGSNGWRLGEYVAASRAIVSEPLRYEVPGGFQAGQNYLEMNSPEEGVARVAGLAADPDRRLRMMQQNHRYYKGFLRPDALVWNSLVTAGSACGCLGDS